ncbi:alpha/beta fold hydrolase [Tistrella mobilis]
MTARFRTTGRLATAAALLAAVVSFQADLLAPSRAEAQLATPAAALCERQIAIKAPMPAPVDASGDLVGSFGFPCAAGADAVLPVVLMLAGSGPTDRDGNQPGLRTDLLRMLAEDLAARGIASLRVDKRGIGASRAAIADEALMTIDLLASDAAQWTRAARRLADGAPVIVLGHSEGGLIALLAARREAPDAIVLAATPGEPAIRTLERQLAQAPMPDDLRRTADRILADLGAGRKVADVPLELAPLFRPSVQPYLISWLGIDPATVMERFAGPVLILQGDRDLQVTTADARRLAAGRPKDTRVEILARLNHVLKPAPADRAGNIAAYTAPGLRPDPRVAMLISAFAGTGAER